MIDFYGNPAGSAEEWAFRLRRENFLPSPDMAARHSRLARPVPPRGTSRVLGALWAFRVFHCREGVKTATGRKIFYHARKNVFPCVVKKVPLLSGFRTGLGSSFWMAFPALRFLIFGLGRFSELGSTRADKLVLSLRLSEWGAGLRLVLYRTFESSACGGWGGPALHLIL